MIGLNRLVVEGAIGNGNLGDDLLIYSLIKLVEGLAIERFVIHSTPQGVSYLKRLFPGVAIVSSDELKLLKDDLILYAGGTQFATFEYTDSRRIPSFKRLCYLIGHPKLFVHRISNRLAGPAFENEIIMLGVGIGPFVRKDVYFHKVIKLLQSCAFLAVRDELSAHICLENQVKYYHFTDLVYSISEEFRGKLNRDHGNDPAGVKKTAVIIRDWDYSSVKETYYKTIENLAETGNIYFVSFSKTADKKVVESIGKYGHKVLQWDPMTYSFESFCVKLSEFDLFITSRYHGAVIASLLNKPFISICIEPKLEMIADKLNMPKWNPPFAKDELVKLKEIATSVASISIYSSKINDEKDRAEQMRISVTNYFLN